jgi:hypothetical protein
MGARGFGLQRDRGRADDLTMQKCPGCGYLVPATWTDCRKCGAALTTAPAPAAMVASAPAAAPAAPAFTAPPTPPSRLGHLVPPEPLPPPVAPPRTTRVPGDDLVSFQPRPSRSAPSSARTPMLIAGAVVVVLVVAGVFMLRGGGGSSGGSPEVLTPHAPSAGLPTNLDDVVRMRAESTRHTAMQAVQSAGGPTAAGVTPQRLAAVQPDYRWLGGDEPSTDSNSVSVVSTPGVVTIAVAGTSTKNICAFARWIPPAPPQYVTMARLSKCAAADAPTEGWSTEAGGAASDLPDESG